MSLLVWEIHKSYVGILIYRRIKNNFLIYQPNSVGNRTEEDRRQKEKEKENKLIQKFITIRCSTAATEARGCCDHASNVTRKKAVIQELYI